MTDRYPEDVLNEYDEDDGTMPASRDALAEAVVGHKIVAAEKNGRFGTMILTLDTGEKVKMLEISDCCAYTDVDAFLLHPELVDHAILGVGTTEGYTKWHIYADMGDVLELTVGWSPGNPFYYAYGFHIAVEPA